MALSSCLTKIDLHQKELAERGNIAFPIACYHDLLYRNEVPWHWHDELEYAVVTVGNPCFLFENSHERLSVGDGIFINSKVLHAAVDNEENGAAELHSAVFHPRVIGGDMDSIFWKNLVNPILKNTSLPYVVLKSNAAWENEVVNGMEAVWQAVAGETDDYENFVRYELSKCMRQIIRNCAEHEIRLSEQEIINAKRIRIMLEFIEQNYMYEIKLDEIASSAALSKSACLRCFKQTIGETPIQHLKNLRLMKSVELLETTQKTVKDIAIEAGFGDVSYFTMLFKEKYHCTPRQYRIKKT